MRQPVKLHDMLCTLLDFGNVAGEDVHLSSELLGYLIVMTMYVAPQTGWGSVSDNCPVQITTFVTYMSGAHDSRRSVDVPSLCVL